MASKQADSKQADRLLLAGIGVLLAVFAFLVWDALRDKTINAGDKAPDFSITTDDGRTVTARSFGGKLLVLNFWATWCPPCIEEIPSLTAFQAQLRDAGVVVVGVSVDRNPKLYKKFLERNKVSFLTARDPEAKISDSYGTYQYPESYIIDSSGVVREKVISSQNWMDPDVIAKARKFLQ